MGISVRNAVDTGNLSDVVNDVNIINNEITREINNLKVSREDQRVELKTLSDKIDSLIVKMGEFSASKHKNNVNKPLLGKTLRLGNMPEDKVTVSTLFQSTNGSLIWADDGGVNTVLVP